MLKMNGQCNYSNYWLIFYVIIILYFTNYCDGGERSDRDHGVDSARDRSDDNGDYSWMIKNKSPAALDTFFENEDENSGVSISLNHNYLLNSNRNNNISSSSSSNRQQYVRINRNFYHEDGDHFAKRHNNNRKGNSRKVKNSLNSQENFSSHHQYQHNQQQQQQQQGRQHQQQHQQQQQRKRRGRGQRQRMNKNALRLLSGIPDNIEGGGAFPPLFNIAPRAKITVNATCGRNGREEYCKLVDAYSHKPWTAQCGICNSQSMDLDKHHSIETVLDSSNDWWQTPTLRNGHQFEYVTITLDLKQLYEVFFIMLKAAISPRPASWILERSLDNITFVPWQYFGLSDTDCRRRYNLPGQTGKYIFKSDTEIICTTQFSKLLPLENGEIHVSLLKNRPGAMEQSQELLDFIMARYIRIRFHGMHSTVNADNSVDWLLDSVSLEKRSFYSLKQIRISGRLACHGHANRTVDVLSEQEEEIGLECLCLHNTCGTNCDRCCPMYNQKSFQNGTFHKENSCQKCECHGHAISCSYNESIKSGICDNCSNYTTGNNCESCLPGYFRPLNSSPEFPCEQCKCNPIGTKGTCDPLTGECTCIDGFSGIHCELCTSGRQGDNCLKCKCDDCGTIPGGECDDHCQCKLHVDGETCSECEIGYFALRRRNPEGCTKCYCSHVGTSCRSAAIETISSFETLDGWKMTDRTRSNFAYPIFDNDTKNLIFGMYDLPYAEAVYWLAPKGYCGNKITSYGSMFHLKQSWVVIRGDTSGKPTLGPNLILIGRNGKIIAFGDDEYDTSSAELRVPFNENGWYHVPKGSTDVTTQLEESENRSDNVTRMQFMSILSNIEVILVRGTFHTDQVESILERATLYAGGSDFIEVKGEQSLIEECSCPPGYKGLSCETCDFGYVRVYENTTNHDLIGKCLPCPCNDHADCYLETGKCGVCQHNTFGERCERCMVGFYGNAMHGTPNDCIPCACPLVEDSNNFSPSCQLKKFTLDQNHFDKADEDFAEYV